MNILIPVSWLKDYLQTDVNAKTLARELSLSGPSVERVEKKGNDYIFDIEVTTNRADASSVFGLAREANAILKNRGEKSSLVLPPGLDINLEPETYKKLTLDILIKNYNLCPRFTLIILDDVKIEKSPSYIKNRLEAVNIRSINNIVDITNFVMLETGQPMHAFDFDKVIGSKMTLHTSSEGDIITTLDGNKRKLPKDSIIISDTKRIIDLCGIMGGENSQITSRTKKVILFAQSYNPNIIRKTCQLMAFRTDAAARFEKGVDIENIPNALRRACYLAKKYSGAKIASELIDINKQQQDSGEIHLNFTKLENYLGMKFDPKKAMDILNSLGFKTKNTQSYLSATVPSWRAKDVTEDVDLIEEIARIHGYHNLASTLPKGEVPVQNESDLKRANNLKNALVYLGLTEVMTYSIISNKLLKLSGYLPNNTVELSNPLTEDWQFMRPSIIPSHLEVLAKNQIIKNDLKIFEIAKTYIKTKNSLPTQDLFLNITLNNSDFYQAKGYIEQVLTIIAKEATFEKFKETDVIFDLNQSATIKIGDTVVGKVGVLDNDFCTSFDIKNPVTSASLNLTACFSLKQIKHQYHPIPKYPPVIEDISAVFSQNTPIAAIVSKIKNASVMVKKIEIIDVFEGSQVGDGKKSVTLRLTFQKSAATPTQNEIIEERQKIIKSLTSELLAKIRA